MGEEIVTLRMTAEDQRDLLLVLTLLETGAPQGLKEIIRHLKGIVMPTVYKPVARTFTTKRKRGKKRSLDYDEILKLYRMGVNGNQIAKKLGCTSSGVYRALRIMGVIK